MKTRKGTRTIAELTEEFGPLEKHTRYGDTYWEDRHGYVRLAVVAGEKYEPRPGEAYGPEDD